MRAAGEGCIFWRDTVVRGTTLELLFTQGGPGLYAGVDKRLRLLKAYTGIIRAHQFLDSADDLLLPCGLLAWLQIPFALHCLRSAAHAGPRPSP